MLKFPYTKNAPFGCRDAWLRDPLSHPDLRVMTLEQLADLPFPPVAAQPEHCGARLAPRSGILTLILARLRRQPA